MIRPCKAMRTQTRTSQQYTRTPAYLDPVCFGIGSHVVDQEAGSQQQGDLEIICTHSQQQAPVADPPEKWPCGTRANTTRTKQQVHRLVRPPAQKHEDGHPPQRKLDAQVDRASAREHRGYQDLAVGEVIVDRLEEEYYGYCAIGGEGYDRE